jgi:hypothetical protein
LAPSQTLIEREIEAKDRHVDRLVHDLTDEEIVIVEEATS